MSIKYTDGKMKLTGKGLMKTGKWYNLDDIDWDTILDKSFSFVLTWSPENGLSMEDVSNREKFGMELTEFSLIQFIKLPVKV